MLALPLTYSLPQGNSRPSCPRAAFSHCHSVGRVILQSGLAIQFRRQHFSHPSALASTLALTFAVSQRQKATASYQLTFSAGWFQYLNSVVRLVSVASGTANGPVPATTVECCSRPRPPRRRGIGRK